ncbi:hypothetical protein GCM10010293_53080 [Streptomyces griseoflavus]|uniref:hypothetical protein n=1 Tax=Streptomyces griseoflavus TaxID=35619 RepID=UPI00167E1F1B|nr:hypothetical protein [Streptomyces griseoflavus]GGV45236.1 hypothetical protein GCM10010293_53080 [Streptomyces griseoflavus]
MRITVTVDDPTDDFRDRLLALLEEHAAHVDTDATWTVERAVRYYRSLPARARRIVRMAAANGGFVGDDELRTDGGSLRGHSGALKRVLERGVREGWWPAGMRPPIEAQGPGFGKVKGYSLPVELVEVFGAAIERYDDQG